MTRRRAFFTLIFLFIGISVFVLIAARTLSGGWLGRVRISGFFRNEPIVSGRGDEVVRVRRVIDGDTVELSTGEKVRYIGVNAPESVDPRRKIECFGKEAAAFNRDLVEGKTIRLERDISDRDKYGRLLRFAYLEDGTLVNEVLVREGYASVMTYPPDVSKKDIFRAAEQEARDEGKGLWNEENCNGKK